MNTRKEVAFYEVSNGFSTFVGTGKEISLNNGNTYAIIKGNIYKVETWDNNSKLILKTAKQ